MGDYRVLCYTRESEDDAVYASKLAYSMHLAVDLGDGKFQELNHNAGVLYAKATQNEDGTLNAMSLKNPWLFVEGDGSFGVLAERILPSGEPDESAKGKLLFFTSKDLLEYEEYPLVTVSKLAENSALAALIAKREKEKNDSTLPGEKGWKEGNIISVPETVAKRLYQKLTVPYNVANEVPEQVFVSSAEEIEKIKATARYSDGSFVEKKVDWDLSKIDFTKKGTYQITGAIHQPHYEFPIAINRADPCVGKWQGKYYFIATNDADGNHTLYMREADTLEGLVEAPESLILDSDTYPHVKGLLWAPEFHIIKGKLYIFHAATPGEFVQEQSHVMMLKENGNPMKKDDWTMPRRVEKKDGSMLYGEQGITLDMTEFEVAGRYYVMWSQRQFSPVDQGAWLYIAEINPDEPWKLISDPVLISMPEYGWANNHTFVDEGPFALITEKKIYVTFSSAAIDSTYVVGMLSADPEADLLQPESWKKCGYPKMSCRTKEGEFGTGHNAYIEDENGLIWNTYHAKPGVDGPRSSGFRRVHFDTEGEPVLEMTEEKDINPELKYVATNVVIE